MSTPIEKLLTLLQSDTTVTDLTDNRIWGGKRVPPESAKYTPDQGAAICFAKDGGVDNYSGGVNGVRWMFKCYGCNDVQANALYEKVADLLFQADRAAERAAAKIFNTNKESGPIDGSEPDTDWPYVLMFCRARVVARN